MKMIEVKNLTFSYGKDKQALHGLNFSVADGEIFGFLGPNGSGKSTTQKILTGILKGHGGEVSLFGKDLRTAQTQEFFQQIGVLFEFPYLYANLSAVDNLNYFASFYPKEQLRDVKELLEELEFKKDFLNKPVSSYSKGMRQRVSMARALISNPKLLGAKTLFATHYHELTELEGKLNNVNNYCIAVKEKGDDIVFLRKIVPGGADKSYGIQVAKLAGLPDSVLERAKVIVEELSANDISDIAKNIQVDTAGKKKKNQLDEVDMTQMSLFDTVKDDDIIAELGSIDISHLTPIEAMNKLYELQNKVKNRW